MVALSSLLLPILLSAVAVFILGFLIHMLLKYHANDFPPVPDQDAVMDAMRKFNIAPGDYMMPRCMDMKEMKTPAFEEKMKKGPVIWMTVLPNGPMGMGKYMVQWFIYCLVVGAFTAFVVSRTQGPGGSQVMLLTSVVSFMGYSLAYWPSSIWYRRKWSTTIKNTFDGALSGIVTGLVFAMMWPKA